MGSLLLAAVIIGCAPESSGDAKPVDAAESAGGDSLGIWYGPGSLNTVTRGIRDDYLEQITDTNNWPTVSANTVVFKQFIESLYGNRYSDEALKELADFTREAGLKCAFEIGALRWTPKLYGSGSGKAYAAEEIEVLQRWVDAGGTVDFLSTDHAVMWNVGLCLQGAKPMAEYVSDPDWRKVMDEVVESLVLIHKAFPDAKIGMIESLGYFSVGDHYTTTDPGSIYPIDMEEFIVAAQEKLAVHGIALDHMHLDFSYQDCRYDGREDNRLDFGRIMAAEQIVKSLSVDSGMIINAFDDESYRGGNATLEKEKAQNPAERSASAVNNTLEYFDGYVAAGGNPDTWILQRWQPYPDVTGPETLRNTDMGVSRLLVNKIIQLKE
jgi:hypothetical protein